MPLLAVVLSRGLVLLAGVLSATGLARDEGWSTFDPAGISSHLGALGNVVAAPAVRWDAVWYLSIAAHGYNSAQSTAFFPLYPGLIRGVGSVTGSAVLAGVLISLGSFVVALMLLHRLTELELGRSAADTTVMLVAFAPAALFFSAVYTESLFLALSVGAAYAARRERWAWAGILAGLAASCRVTGVLLIMLALLPARGRARQSLRTRMADRRRAWMLLAPVGLVAYLGSLTAAGFGPLAPFHAQASSLYARSFRGPLASIWEATTAAFHGLVALGAGSTPPVAFGSLAAPFAPAAESIYLLVVLALAIAALGVCFRRLPVAYGLLALLALAVSIWSPVAAQPLKSLDRYLLTIFPLWMVAGAWLAERRLARPVLALSTVLLLLFTVQFASWTFVA